MSKNFMVEAPGTAPGSEWFISTAIYCRSQTSWRDLYNNV